MNMSNVDNDITLENILVLLEKHNITAYEIEKNTNLTAVGVQKIIDGKTKRPNKSTLETINSYITNKYNSYTKAQSTPQNMQTSNEVKHILKETPFYDVDFYSGFKSIFNDQTIQPSFFFYHPDFLKAEFAVKNSGKSMGEVLSGNDIIGLKQIHNWKDYFPQGEIYAVVTSNDLRTVKYVRRDPTNKKLVLIPKPKEEDKFLFPEYEEVPIDMVIAIFQVVASLDSRKLAM